MNNILLIWYKRDGEKAWVQSDDIEYLKKVQKSYDDETCPELKTRTLLIPNVKGCM